MIAKIKRFWWVLKNLNPLNVNSMFYHIHNFKGGDPMLYGYKRAILYGSFYFIRSNYDDNGMIDMSARSRKQDEIINEMRNPVDRLEYLSNLRKLRNGVEQANKYGYFSCGDNAAQNKIEATYYQQAIDCLDVLIPAVIIYPFLWRKIFLRRS